MEKLGEGMVCEKIRGVLVSLIRVKQELLESMSEWTQAGRYETVERGIAVAKGIDQIIKQVSQIEAAPSPPPPPDKEKFPVDPGKLPFFYVDRRDRLVMRGPGRGEFYYEQRLVKTHFDLICQKLRRIQQNGRTVRTQELQNRAEMPVHEPGIAVKALAKEGILIPLQKGLYNFATANDIQAEAQDVWTQLPRE